MVKHLGEGSQGTVFLGESPDGGQVAIKIMHHCLAADPHVRNRFQREAEIAASVATFSTARVLETGFAEDRPYIISEYVPGPSLEELVDKDGPRTGGGLERLAVTTLTALASIHSAGVVHRDFKPGNVIMGPEGPVVIDFGIALALDTAGTTEPAGTPAYMSPEQFADQAIAAASDMFSWAGTMVYAATGRPAFSESTVPATLNAIFHAEPDLSGIPEPLAQLVAACLAKDPAARPSAVEVLCDLVGGHRGLSTAATDAPAGQAHTAATDTPASQVHTAATGVSASEVLTAVTGVPADQVHPGRPRHRHHAEGPARPPRRARAEGRHAISPALMTMTTIVPPPAKTVRRRRRVAALTGVAALAVTAATLFLSSASGGTADAQGGQVGGSATISNCAADPAPSAPRHRQAAASSIGISVRCDTEAGGLR
ncbi:hypothetical protein Acor_28990 [Acrocarpospora corrugata]|uniref:Protein kinase domain-containing protein n=1 Tax=Acrocarpospora corrugata TaxID=35763 RepID=A0A5M3VVK4_9ACTN|nr:serine/threonine-protein kinase [Acrocarpospora corrugata]GES00835.1 hypothetical protein Acor_28990 [Acrocarpospora corrugata]